ncbi:uncharacterized protein LOC107986837 isoform X2 [Homo sapiens]|uniref:uncharacterized protein LOC107986837 isoform X2 n=1 Tax=Homo sapiens TaxID=9606 RepID=UPI001FB1773D|nr:uncharacterized protein LOC107986837 isoform X2 [Homo sapiens]XP_047300950.1 uncharacterized protein LOC107986837 isoform X2 [Homo sapiens]
MNVKTSEEQDKRVKKMAQEPQRGGRWLGRVKTVLLRTEEMRWGWSMKMNDCFLRHCGEEAVERWQQQTVERSQFTGSLALPQVIHSQSFCSIKNCSFFGLGVS